MKVGVRPQAMGRPVRHKPGETRDAPAQPSPCRNARRGPTFLARTQTPAKGALWLLGPGLGRRGEGGSPKAGEGASRGRCGEDTESEAVSKTPVMQIAGRGAGKGQKKTERERVSWTCRRNTTSKRKKQTLTNHVRDVPVHAAEAALGLARPPGSGGRGGRAVDGGQRVARRDP